MKNKDCHFDKTNITPLSVVNETCIEEEIKFVPPIVSGVTRSSADKIRFNDRTLLAMILFEHAKTHLQWARLTL